MQISQLHNCKMSPSKYRGHMTLRPLPSPPSTHTLVLPVGPICHVKDQLPEQAGLGEAFVTQPHKVADQWVGELLGAARLTRSKPAKDHLRPRPACPIRRARGRTAVIGSHQLRTAQSYSESPEMGLRSRGAEGGGH